VGKTAIGQQNNCNLDISYDCNHPEEKDCDSLGHGQNFLDEHNSFHRSEIHPPKAVISFRMGIYKFSSSHHSVRTNDAIVFINRNGGYWNQDIKDICEFDV
jgi:hypothetical protein